VFAVCDVGPCAGTAFALGISMHTALLRFTALLCLLLIWGEGASAADRDGEGILRLAALSEIDSLDPIMSDANGSRMCVLNIYDQLFRYHYLKRPFELEPSLAAAMPSVSKDRLTWTIKLRGEIRYADDPCFPGGKGRTICAADVVFCLKRVMDVGAGSKGSWLLLHRLEGMDEFLEASKSVKADPKRAAYTKEAGYPEVSGLEVVDPLTVRIKLKRPWPALPWVLAMSYGSIYPPEAVAHHGAEFAKHPVTTGPYLVQSYPSGRRLMLKRNPSYREDRYPSEGGEGDEETGILADAGAKLPLNAFVTVTAAPDPMKRWLRFAAGDLDYCRVPRDAMWSVVEPKTFALLPASVKRGYALHDGQRLEVNYEAFNMRNPVFGQKAGARGRAIRRAICLAADDEWSIQWLYGGMATPMQGPLLPEHPEYDSFFRNQWMRQPDEPKEDTLELARDILKEAGMEGGKGIPPLRRQVLDHESSRKRFARFQKDTEAIGLRFRPEFVSWEELRARIKAGTADMWTTSWILDHPDAENLLQLFYGPHAGDPNDSRYANPEFDKLYERALLLPPGDERAMLYQEMQEIVVEDCVYRWRFRERQLHVTQPWFSNWRGNDIAPRFFAYCRSDTAARNAHQAARNEKDEAGTEGE
jgi:ABC-type transport system substrate-binding protein